MFSNTLVSGNRPLSRRVALAILFASALLVSASLFSNQAEAHGPSYDFSNHSLLPAPADYPLFFRATTNFQELYLGMVLSDLGGISGNYLGALEPPEEPEAPENEWRMPDDIRHEVEAENDPIPPYEKYDELWHVVDRRQTKARLDEMFRYPATRLEELNPQVNFENLQPGEKILVWKRSPFPSQSYGKANRGRLLNGEPLKPVPGIKLIYPHRVFGTTHTVALIQSVLDSFHRHFPLAHPILIGDISMQGGGFTRPHHSHQSGRDADIAYPTILPATQFRRFTRTRTKNLDAKQALWLLKRFIDTGYVEYIFADRRLQRVMVKEAEAEGAPKEWIQAVFQYRGRPNAIVRHAHGHVNHFHVRFRCTSSDLNCRDSIADRERALEGEEVELGEVGD